MFSNGVHVQRKQHPPKRILLGVVSMLLIVVLAGGCDVKIPDFTDPTNKALGALDDAIDRLGNASADWQVVLQDTIAKLTDSAQSSVRTEVSNTLERAMATTSGEFRCDVDFLRTRIRQDLLRIRARLLNISVEAPEPSFCTVVPPAVDMALEPGRRNLVTFFGYDFDTTPPTQVQLVETNRTLDVSNKLDRQTHYHMTLNLGGNGVPLSASSQELVLRWKDREISTIPVIQPTTPVCRSKIDRISDSSAITFVPPHTSGDAEFGGHGPRVTAIVQLLKRGTQVVARITMNATETERDWTSARGTKEYPLYTAQPGWTVRQIVGPWENLRAYTDSNTTIDFFEQGPGDPVKRYEFVGDTNGLEAGTRTQVKVFFNPVQLELVETSNCVPRTTLRALQSENLLAPDTTRRLQSTGVITP